MFWEYILSYMISTFISPTTNFKWLVTLPTARWRIWASNPMLLSVITIPGQCWAGFPTLFFKGLVVFKWLPARLPALSEIYNNYLFIINNYYISQKVLIATISCLVSFKCYLIQGIILDRLECSKSTFSPFA